MKECSQQHLCRNNLGVVLLHPRTAFTGPNESNCIPCGLPKLHTVAWEDVELAARRGLLNTITEAIEPSLGLRQGARVQKGFKGTVFRMFPNASVNGSCTEPYRIGFQSDPTSIVPRKKDLPFDF